jgi:hypothetical protein
LALATPKSHQIDENDYTEITRLGLLSPLGMVLTSLSLFHMTFRQFHAVALAGNETVSGK